MEQNIVILIIIILSAMYIYFRKMSRGKFVKTQAMKKEEIIQSYEKQVNDLLLRYQDDESERLEEKKRLLVKINKELVLNIFFDEMETKAVIQHLASINLKT